MLVKIEKRLRQASEREDLPYGRFIVILVGYFQQLSPVGDKPMYTEGNSEASLLFKNIQNVVILKQPQRQVGNSSKHSKEANGLYYCLYLAKGADIMLTSILWNPVGLHNGARGKVIDDVYMYSDGP